MTEGFVGLEVQVFSGRFGSGKSEVALNYALALARGDPPGVGGDGLSPARDRAHLAAAGDTTGARQEKMRVVLVDLDIVTPYFRSRELADRMQEHGVQVIAPGAIGRHLDTPVITPQILGAIEQTNQAVVLDVGGDPQGARALGQFSPAIRRRGYAMYFVVNPYRPFTSTLEGLSGSIGEVEHSSRLQVTSLVSNPNLMGDTTAEGILEGHAQIEEFARRLGLPISFVCIEQGWAGRLNLAALAQPVLILARHFTQA
ncbi:MAG: hypothetical protein EHM56_03215 [Chloroflexi bacterium]|nr:MAG: hypothetical protein EHM56_03215 [Chloroflexota bacterium]